jgi:predicted PurR-regulated permease PerM
MTSQEPLPTTDLDTADDGASLVTMALVSISGALAGWAVVRGLLRARRQDDAPSLDAARSAATARDLSSPPPNSGQALPDASHPHSDARVPAQPSTVAAPESPGSRQVAGAASSAAWSRPTKYLVSTGLILAAILGMYWIRGILPMLVTAGLIAFVVQPLRGWFQTKLHLPHNLSTVLAYSAIVLMVLAIPLILVPSILDAMNELRNLNTTALTGSLNALLTRALDLTAPIPLLGPIVAQALEPLRVMLAGQPGAAAGAAPLDSLIATEVLNLLTVGRVTGAITPLLSWIVAAIFAVLISVYLSSGRYSVRNFILDKAPSAYVPELSTLFDRIGWTWSSFLQGQLKLMFLIGFAVFVGNALLGNRYAAMLGLIAGVLEIIPNIGPILALIPGVLGALIFGSSWLEVSNLLFALIVLGFYSLVQLLENQYVVPRILGDAVELPPLVVLLAVLIGGSVGGILGALIAVPVVGTLKEIVGYLYGKIIEAPDMEAPPELKPGLFQTITMSARNLTNRLFGAGR